LYIAYPYSLLYLRYGVGSQNLRTVN
jgi:hypothetical protein